MKILGKWIDDIFVKEQPAGLVNGSNQNYTLSEDPHPSYGVDVYVNGLYVRESIHYTLTGKTITMNTAPESNSDIFCKYIKV